MSAVRHLKRTAAVSLLLLACPLISRGTNVRLYVFNPPLGTVEEMLLPILLLAGLGVTTFLPLFLRKKGRVASALIAGGLTLGSLLTYGFALIVHGRKIEVPSRNISAFVIVGDQRTTFAQQYFADSSDVEMLKKRGWGQNELELYFSKVSLVKAQLEVLLSFASIFWFLNLLIGSVVSLNEDNLRPTT